MNLKTVGANNVRIDPEKVAVVVPVSATQCTVYTTGGAVTVEASADETVAALNAD